jgi:hypothetical protein
MKTFHTRSNPKIILSRIKDFILLDASGFHRVGKCLLLYQHAWKLVESAMYKYRDEVEGSSIMVIFRQIRQQFQVLQKAKIPDTKNDDNSVRSLLIFSPKPSWYCPLLPHP